MPVGEQVVPTRYFIDQLLARFAEGQALINEAGLPATKPLIWLLDDLMEPVKVVFETLGLDPDPAFAAYL